MKKLFFFLLLTFSLGTFAQAPGHQKGKDIIEVVQKAGVFSTLLSAIEVTGLGETLKNKRLYTLFAPTDEAFAKLPGGTLNYLFDNPKILKQILLYHLTPRKLYSDRVVRMNEIKTLAGKTIATNVNSDGAFLNKSRILKSDIRAQNGLIHIIDKVLVYDETTPDNNIQTVNYVDLEKYLGKWYEIARYKNSFQKKCLGTTAEYGKKWGYITVTNKCQMKSGKVMKARALATVANKKTNASLKVSFVPFLNIFGLFAGDYNILELGPDYDYVLVGDRARQTFWILARTKTIPDALYEELLDVAKSRGYRKELIFKTPVWID